MTAHIEIWRRYARHSSCCLAIVLAALALAGCGFHLEGAGVLPKGVTAMNVSYDDPYRVGDPTLVQTLKQRLRQRHLLGDASAPAQLDIASIHNNQRVLAVSPVDGNTAAYELIASVTFSYSVNGADQLDDQTLTVTRQYSYDDAQRLAAESEQSNLLDAMQNELANLVLTRIAQVNGDLARSAPAS